MCSDGRAKRCKATTAEAGFPGREKMMRLVDRSPVLDLKGIVAKVVGLPGFMATRPKWMVPPKERSMTGLRRSSSPIETPPVVTMISTERIAVRREASRVSSL